MIISDDQVYPLYGDALTRNLEKDYEVSHVVVEHGETSKRFDTVSYTHLLEILSKVCTIWYP